MARIPVSGADWSTVNPATAQVCPRAVVSAEAKESILGPVEVVEVCRHERRVVPDQPEVVEVCENGPARPGSIVQAGTPVAYRRPGVPVALTTPIRGRCRPRLRRRRRRRCRTGRRTCSGRQRRPHQPTRRAERDLQPVQLRPVPEVPPAGKCRIVVISRCVRLARFRTPVVFHRHGLRLLRSPSQYPLACPTPVFKGWLIRARVD